MHKICNMSVHYVFKKYIWEACALCNACRIKNVFLESPRDKTDFCIGFAFLSTFYQHMHLHEHPHSTYHILLVILRNSVYLDTCEINHFLDNLDQLDNLHYYLYQLIWME